MSDKAARIKKTEPLTLGMTEIIKHMRRGAELCRVSEGYCFLVTTANSISVRARDVSGLLKRDILTFEEKVTEIDWYKLSERGKTINLDQLD